MKGSYQPNCAQGQLPGYASHAEGVAKAAAVVNTEAGSAQPYKGVHPIKRFRKAGQQAA